MENNIITPDDLRMVQAQLLQQRAQLSAMIEEQTERKAGIDLRAAAMLAEAAYYAATIAANEHERAVTERRLAVVEGQLGTAA